MNRSVRASSRLLSCLIIQERTGSSLKESASICVSFIMSCLSTFLIFTPWGTGDDSLVEWVKPILQKGETDRLDNLILTST